MIFGTIFLQIYQRACSPSAPPPLSTDWPQCIVHMFFFQALYLHSKSRNREFLLRVSYMEIYNEIITDLVNPKLSNLRVRKNTDKEISVEKLTEKVVTSVDEVIDVMRLGEKNRHIGCTNMNEKSSRLHTMFRMVSVIILRNFNLKILTTD